MPQNLKIYLYLSIGIFILFVASTLASIIFYFLSGYDINAVKPWSIWNFLNNPASSSRFFLSMTIAHLSVGAGIFSFFNKNAKPNLGDSSWATLSEIKNMGYLKKDGLLLGKYKGRYLINDEPGHVFVAAATRSGKGTGLVIPNLLDWPDSLLCIDLKKENFMTTAGFRQAQGHEIFVFAPFSTDDRSHRYNPLHEISKEPHKRFQELRRLATILIPHPLGDNKYWTSQGRALFIALCYYVLDKQDRPSTLGEVFRMLGAEQELGDIARHIAKTFDIEPEIKGALNQFANKAAKERSGIAGAMGDALNLWGDRSIDSMTSECDFSLSDLRKKRMSIYLCVATGDLPSVAPLLRIFFEQVMTDLTRSLPGKDEPYKVLLMMDEFHMLGNMEIMPNIFTLSAGYNCRAVAVVQTTAWVDSVYDKNIREGIINSCKERIFFAANDLTHAKYISECIGNKTIEVVTTSQNKSSRLNGPSKTLNYRSQPLLTADQVMRLPKDEQIILAQYGKPILCKKITYYNDKNFLPRLLPAPIIPLLQIQKTNLPTFNIKESKIQQDKEDDENFLFSTAKQKQPEFSFENNLPQEQKMESFVERMVRYANTQQN